MGFIPHLTSCSPPCTQVSLDYNAGFTGALGALLTLLAPNPPPLVRRTAQPSPQPQAGQ